MIKILTRRTKNIIFCLVFVILIFTLFSCNTSTEDNYNSVSTNESPLLPSDKNSATLQNIIDNANPGETIDLSQYKNITDYTATVNKTLIIKNGSLANAKLTVLAQDVKLERLEKLSVSTSSKLTINDSKLEKLLIGSNETSRAFLGGTQTTPIVSLKGCEISENIEIKDFNSQLNITDTATKIAKITATTKCKVILEAGKYEEMSDPIVTNDGEVTRIDMTKGNRPVTLSIYSYPKKVEYNVGDKIDCNGLIVMGVYVASAGQVFKSGGWKGEAKDAVIKWENENDYEIIYNFDTDGTQIVTVRSKNDESVQCYFPVVVKASSDTNENLSVIKNITLDKVEKDFRTLYYVGETLDLSCFQVVGEYDNGNKVNLPFTSEPTNGTILKNTGEYTITFYYNEKKLNETATISVVSAVNVDFTLGNGVENDEICTLKVPLGGKVEYPYFPENEKYSEHLWYSEDIHGIAKDDLIASEDMEIIGYGIDGNKDCIINFMNLDGSLAKTFNFKANDIDEDTGLSILNKELNSICPLDRIAYIHYTWSTNKECDTEHNQNIEKIVECSNNDGTKCLPHYSSVCNIFENNFLLSDKFEITLYPVFHTKEYFIKYLMSSDYALICNVPLQDCVEENGTHYHKQLFNINDESLILRENTFTANETFDLNFSGWSIANWDTANYGVKYTDCQTFANNEIKNLIEYIEESTDDSTLELYTVWE
ncbi:MAG: bacterial Ig-like domain-containing protein [Spirochaetales bacterium]|nr:bacterial Ig-like domain-containing protein [Spirochaetales bacterium]